MGFNIESDFQDEVDLRMELKPTPPHAEERRSAIHRAQAFQFARAATRLGAWPLARSRLWPSFETRAILRGARPKRGTRASG
jgi:hypothetical protein